MLSGGDVDYIDPGQTYYSYTIGIMNALHRGLYAYRPAGSSSRFPIWPRTLPEISADGKTVTVKISKGVMFSKPVNREVEAKDVKYAIERAFTANVPNGYARAYLGDIVGAPKEPGPYKEIPGIETPDKNTIVFKLTQGHRRAAGRRAVDADLDPGAEGVRGEVRREDRRRRTAPRDAVYTGPYMVESDANGKAIGYKPGRRIHLVRNPDYAPVDDWRPAYLDEIEILAGNDDTAVASRRILSGESMASGDIEPPARQLKRCCRRTSPSCRRCRAAAGASSPGTRSARRSTTSTSARRCSPGFNRVAARQQRGGEAIGPIAQGLHPAGHRRVRGVQRRRGLA